MPHVGSCQNQLRLGVQPHSPPTHVQQESGAKCWESGKSLVLRCVPCTIFGKPEEEEVVSESGGAELRSALR